MFILLLLAWIVFNGNFTLEILLFGIGVAAVVYLFACKFLDFSIRKDILCIRKAGIFLWYVVSLIWEIIKANFVTIKWIMSNRYEVEPVLISFDMNYRTRIAQVLFANAITLTPGTITVKLEDNHFTVHALDQSYTKGINGGRIADILYRLEEKL